MVKWVYINNLNWSVRCMGAIWHVFVFDSSARAQARERFLWSRIINWLHVFISIFFLMAIVLCLRRLVYFLLYDGILLLRLSPHFLGWLILDLCALWGLSRQKWNVFENIYLGFISIVSPYLLFVGKMLKITSIIKCHSDINTHSVIFYVLLFI